MKVKFWTATAGINKCLEVLNIAMGIQSFMWKQKLKM
jgi:cbb3-type cytochrome oxidase subunit 1